MVFPPNRDGTRVLGQRALEKRQRCVSKSVVDAVHPAVPGPTSEIMVQPFDERSGKRSVGVADQPFELGLEPAEIAFLIECRGAGQRVELAVKRPENCPRAIAAVEQVKEIPPNLAAAAVQRDRIAADPVCPLL